MPKGINRIECRKKNGRGGTKKKDKRERQIKCFREKGKGMLGEKQKKRFQGRDGKKDGKAEKRRRCNEKGEGY